MHEGGDAAAAGPLHVVARGRRGAPPVVLLHHFGGSARTWQRVTRRLAGAHYCLAVDLRGWGGSPRLGGAAADAYTVADAAAEAGRCVAAHVGAATWWLAGHSMGGKVALALAATRPNGLAGLLLAAPSTPTPEPMRPAERARLATARSGSGARETARHAAARPLDPAARRGLADDARRADPAAWAWWLDRGSREDLAALAPQVAVPTRVLAGARDGALGPAVQERETVARMPGARLTVVDGAGHLLPLEAPDAVAEAVAALVQERAVPNT